MPVLMQALCSLNRPQKVLIVGASSVDDGALIYVDFRQSWRLVIHIKLKRSTNLWRNACGSLAWSDALLASTYAELTPLLPNNVLLMNVAINHFGLKGRSEAVDAKIMFEWLFDYVVMLQWHPRIYFWQTKLQFGRSDDMSKEMLHKICNANCFLVCAHYSRELRTDRLGWLCIEKSILNSCNRYSVTLAV